ncbi:MAG: phenylalanine--tRNA ligase subunit beta [Planctomycetaceae bacterium]|nr:phenylalanine--tRNA ligase subunit beta [Planctomycetaceae bacterium]
MLVSWSWLRDYVPLTVSADEFAERLMMAGLNHESTESVGDDLAIDLEVTSNRPDCLGHLGIAREAAVLFGVPLKLPAAEPKSGATAVDTLTKVRIDAPQLCSRYIARVIRGVKVKSSPSWLVKRLATIGQPSINNIVDITNYVLMECGQPLHAFDFRKLAGNEIIVREARAGEKIEAIDHKTYELSPGLCVIADRDRPVAIAGVMGGAATEVGPATVDVLIESAEFDPASIRATARKLNLHSDSSYRFERGLDPEGVDWASRRCCELILELAGGELAAGSVDVGRKPAARQPIVLRLSQIKRILGIEIPTSRVAEILTALGSEVRKVEPERIEAVAPSWRADLTREIDLIEEAARIHGYDAIPEDVRVPMATSARSREDRVLGEVRQVLIGSGFDEAFTISVVEPEWSESFSPWSDVPPLSTAMPILRRANQLRRSLVPSLLGARRTNETLANPRIELFEIAKVYLPQPGQLPDERLMLALTSGQSFLQLKGVIENLLERLHIAGELTVKPSANALFEPGRGVELLVAGERLGFLGELSRAGRSKFELRGAATVVELRLDALTTAAQLVPRYAPIPAFPAIERDVNLVVDERVRWADMARQIRNHGGPLLEQVDYRDTYRDPQRLGSGKKSLLFSLKLRSAESTLTSQQADSVRDTIVAACKEQLGAELRA